MRRRRKRRRKRRRRRTFKVKPEKNSPKLLQLTPIMCVPSLLSGIKNLNKLILAKSKKFTLAVSSNVRFVLRAEFQFQQRCKAACLEGVRSVQTLVRGVFSIQKREGGNPRNSEVYKACTAENVRKIGVKSTVLELQKTYRYKSSSIINFQNNGTG